MTANEKLMAEAVLDDKQTKLKRRLLSTIRFIGELFKEGLLKPSIMYECIDNLIALTDEDGNFTSFKVVQDEQSIELLCRLLHTIGAKLESQENSSTAIPLNFYFVELSRISKDKKLNSRIRFSLEEVITLRHNKWTARREEEGPAKLEQIHEKAAAEEAAKAQWAAGGGQQYGQHGRFNQPQDNRGGGGGGGQQDARGPRNQGGQGQGQGQDRGNFSQSRDNAGGNYQGDARDQRGYDNRSGKGQGQGQGQQGNNQDHNQNQGRGQQQQQRQQNQPQQQQKQSQQGNQNQNQGQGQGQQRSYGSGGGNSPQPSSSQGQTASSHSAGMSEAQITEHANSAVEEYVRNKNPGEALLSLQDLPKSAAGSVILKVIIGCTYVRALLFCVLARVFTFNTFFSNLFDIF